MNSADSDDYLYSSRQAHGVLALLFALMALDFVDRGVLAALLPAIKAEWGRSDTELGLLVSAVNVAIAVLALSFPLGLVVVVVPGLQLDQAAPDSSWLARLGASPAGQTREALPRSERLGGPGFGLRRRPRPS